MAAAAPLFDAAQLTSFFEGPDFMGLSNRMRLQLAHEGITVRDDFKDYDAEGLKGIFLNLLKPPKVPAARRFRSCRGSPMQNHGLRSFGEVQDAPKRRTEDCEVL